MSLSTNLSAISSRGELVRTRNDHKPNLGDFLNPKQFEHLDKIIQFRMGAVCQINTPISQGMGCLIGGNLIMTNFHVIPNEETASKSEASFFHVLFQNADKTSSTISCERLKLDPSIYLYISPIKARESGMRIVDSDHLGFTIIALAPHPYLEIIQDKAFSIFQNIEAQNNSLACVLQSDNLDFGMGIKGGLKWAIDFIHKYGNYLVHYGTQTTDRGSVAINVTGNLIAIHYQKLDRCDCDFKHRFCNMGVLITEISKALEKKGERARLERLITCYTVRKIAPTTGLTKNELVRAIAQKSGLTRKDAEEALDAFVATVKTAMKKKEKVNLVGFGTWELPQRKARRPINPRTGQEIKIPAGRVPIFKAGKALKELALTGTIEQARPKEVPESLRTSLEEQKKRSSEKGYSTE